MGLVRYSYKSFIYNWCKYECRPSGDREYRYLYGCPMELVNLSEKDLYSENDPVLLRARVILQLKEIFLATNNMTMNPPNDFTVTGWLNNFYTRFALMSVFDSVTYKDIMEESLCLYNWLMNHTVDERKEIIALVNHFERPFPVAQWLHRLDYAGEADDQNSVFSTPTPVETYVNLSWGGLN